MFWVMFALAIGIMLLVLALKKGSYEAGSYSQITKVPFFQRKRNVGCYGEYLIYEQLKSLENSGMRFLFNAYIPTNGGTTAEIDVLLLCNKGVIVIESKNYGGWIFGSEHQRLWYQTLPAGDGLSTKESFYNPIMQNRSHIRHLARLIGENIPMYSFVVFSDRCKLKNIAVNSSDVRVVRRKMLYASLLDLFHSVPGNALSEQDVAGIYERLYPYTQTSPERKSIYISNAQRYANLQSNKSSPKSKPLVKGDGYHCPQCGGKLILRTATKGVYAGNPFLGCANYPKCRYIQSLK